jgi:hypothetical protein
VPLLARRNDDCSTGDIQEGCHISESIIRKYATKREGGRRQLPIPEKRSLHASRIRENPPGQPERYSGFFMSRAISAMFLPTNIE